MAAYYSDQRPFPSQSPRTWQHHPPSQRLAHDYHTRSPSASSDGYYYDPRYSYPPLKTSSRPSSCHSTSTDLRSRQGWPPHPTVEDEVHALANESNVTKSPEENGDAARSRGPIDQQPIILDADAPADGSANNAVEAGDSTNLEPCDDGDSPGYASLTRGNRKEAQRGRNHSPHLEAAQDEVPVQTRRDPSPYAFAKPDKSMASGFSNSGIHLSPGGMTAEGPRPTPEKRKSGSYAFVGDPQNKPKPEERKAPAPRDSGYYTSSFEEQVVEGPDYGATESTNLRERRKPAAFSFNKSDLKDARTSLYDTVDMDRRSNAKGPFLQPGQPQDSRRNTDSATTIPKPRFDEGPGKPLPLRPSAASSGIPPPIRLPNAESFTSVKSQSPKSIAAQTPSVAGYYASPLSSRRSSYRHDESSLSEPRSQPGSRPGSRPSSRPNSSPPSPVSLDNSATTSPPPLRFGFDSNNRTSTYPPTVDRRTRPTSKLASSVSTDSSPSAPQIDVRGADMARPQKQPLPYPEGEPQLMPSMDDFTSNAARRKPAAISNNPLLSRVRAPPSPATPVASSFDLPGATIPRLPSRHTFGEVIPKLGSRSSSHASSSDVNLDFKSSIPSLTKPLPPCPRAEYSRNYDDWYTLEGCPSFDICSNCLTDIVAPTGLGFLRYFKRSPRRPSNVKIRCDFGTPWMRLAWLLTLKRQRSDLDLIYTLARISSTEAECPVSTPESRIWYNVIDEHGNTMKNFNICTCDAKQILALLPSLRRSLVPAYIAGPRDDKRMCDLTIESQRFPRYLDLLVDIDLDATAEGKLPDLRPFLDLVRQNARIRPCLRDNYIAGEGWLFIPTVVDFTVCPECYNDVILPHALSNPRSLASRFIPTPQRVAGEGELGTSCTLYSPRMRNIFKRAVEKNDIDYLAKKSAKRRDVERELRSEHEQVVRWQGRGPGGVEPEVLRRELEMIVEDWKKWE